MRLAGGQGIKVIPDVLDHVTGTFTADVYTEVAEELADATAAATAALVPRQKPLGEGAQPWLGEAKTA